MRKSIGLSLYILIFSIFIYSCKPENNLNKLWFYTHTNSGNTTSPAIKLTPANFINLSADGKYTMDLGEYEFGTWKQRDKQIELTNSNKKTSTITIHTLSGNEMQIITKNKHDEIVIDNFEGVSNSFRTENEDPFSKQNNLWRIHAGNKETDEQVKQRLLNHFKFWEMYFNWGLETSRRSLDVRSTPSLLKIYGNGFQLKPFDELPAAWKSYFYNEEDCRRANEIIEILFEKENIAWPHTDNKYKMFISAFQQLQQKLK